MNIRFREKIAARVLIGLVTLYVLFQTGCAPTYPKEMVDKAVIQLCKEEYSIDVKVKLAGTTIAVYLPIENLLDQTLGISKQASEKINDVILSVSRVTLSTDAPIKFYLVIAQDPKLTEVEIVIIRYVDDIKWFHFSRISRGEFFNRALIELKLTPQAQKEKILRAIFEQLQVEESEELLDEFLAKDVSTIGDIGYWNDQFFIKEVNLEEFLALQVVGRAKRKFEGDPELKDRFKVNFIKGRFVDWPEKKNFEFDLNVTPYNELMLFMSDEESEIVFKTVLDVTTSVLHGYKFEDFHGVSLSDEVSGEHVYLTKSELDDFRNGKLEIGDLRWRR